MSKLGENRLNIPKTSVGHRMWQQSPTGTSRMGGLSRNMTHRHMLLNMCTKLVWNRPMNSKISSVLWVIARSSFCTYVTFDLQVTLTLEQKELVKHNPHFALSMSRKFHQNIFRTFLVIDGFSFSTNVTQVWQPDLDRRTKMKGHAYSSHCLFHVGEI